MKLWRRSNPAPAPVEIPGPRTEVPMEGPTEGEVARQRAEEALDEEVRRTEAIRQETHRYERQASRWRSLYEENHLREQIIGAIKGGA